MNRVGMLEAFVVWGFFFFIGLLFGGCFAWFVWRLPGFAVGGPIGGFFGVLYGKYLHH